MANPCLLHEIKWNQSWISLRIKYKCAPESVFPNFASQICMILLFFPPLILQLEPFELLLQIPEKGDSPNVNSI
jgi:hypothetical protein